MQQDTPKPDWWISDELKREYNRWRCYTVYERELRTKRPISDAELIAYIGTNTGHTTSNLMGSRAAGTPEAPVWIYWYTREYDSGD